jgi:hypothetical protein
LRDEDSSGLGVEQWKIEPRKIKSISCDKFAVSKWRKMGFWLSIKVLHRHHNEFTIKGRIGLHKLTGTQIAVLTALVEAEDQELSEAQEFAACHRACALKLVRAGMLAHTAETQFQPTELGKLVLKRELLTRELKRTNLAIDEAYKNQKPAMRSLLQISGLATSSK